MRQETVVQLWSSLIDDGWTINGQFRPFLALRDFDLTLKQMQDGCSAENCWHLSSPKDRWRKIT